MNHLRVAMHVPNGNITQEVLDTALENVKRMALQQNKGDRPIFLLLDTQKVKIDERTPGDDSFDFVIRFHMDKELK